MSHASTVSANGANGESDSLAEQASQKRPT